MRRLILAVPYLIASTQVVPLPAHARTAGGFELGALVQLHRDRTRDDGVVRGAGTIGAIHLGYTETLGHGWFVRAVADAGSGGVSFATEGATTGGLETRLVELQLHAGRDIPLGRANLTPFIGLLSRVVDTDGKGAAASDGTPLYRRSLRSVLAPVGATLAIPVGRTRVELTAQTNIFIGGEARSRFSDANSALPDTRLDIRGGRGFGASAAIVAPLGRRTLAVGPFWRQTGTARSEAVNIIFDGQPTSLVEPRTIQTETGLRAVLRF